MKLSLSILILFLTLPGLYAQTIDEADTEQDSTESLTFFDNFYIEAGGGSQILFSKDVENLDNKQRLTPSLSLSVGKWFSGTFGAGIKFQGYSLNGFSTTEGTYTAAPDNGNLFEQDPVRKEVTINPDGTYRHFIRYTNISLNFYASIVNLLTGCKEHNIFDIIPSVGIGNMHVFAYKGVPKTNTLSANFGLTGKFHLSPVVDLNINACTAIFDNKFEGRIAGTREYENYVSASIGIVYYVKSRKF